MIDLAERPDPEHLSFDQLIDECQALRGIIAGLGAPPARPRPRRDAPPRLDPARLSPIECRLFVAFADKPGAVLTPGALRAAAYADRPGRISADETITVHLSKLRRKLAGTPFAISNAWGRGWYLEGDKGLARRSAAEIQAGSRAATAAVGGRGRAGSAAGTRATR